jgi:hypothetical protein
MFDTGATTPLVWQEGILTADDLLYFRGDNPYVWQLRGQNADASAYALATYYIKSIDTMSLLSRLAEDGRFGNFVFSVDDTIVSRDLLDSIAEIYFLERHLRLSMPGKRCNVLDIGAGYGRLAHRMLVAFPNIDLYVCADAVAESTFISEYYLGFRGLSDRARVVPLDEIDDSLLGAKIDLAINIHSFSECRLDAIDWWMSILAKHKVNYLMVVPNSAGSDGESLLTNDGQEMSGVIERHGYRRIARDPKYLDPVVQTYAAHPAFHFLFERVR